MVVSFHVNIVTRQPAQFLFGAAFLLRLQPALALAAFAGIALVAVAAALYGAFACGLAEKVQELFTVTSALAETSFSMSKTVRAFDGGAVETEKYEASQYAALRLEEMQVWPYRAQVRQRRPPGGAAVRAAVRVLEAGPGAGAACGVAEPRSCSASTSCWS
jgi:hypothetical protein